MMFLIVILLFFETVYGIVNYETAKLSDNRLSTIYTLNLLGERKQCCSRFKEIDLKIAVSYPGKSIPILSQKIYANIINTYLET